MMTKSIFCSFAVSLMFVLPSSADDSPLAKQMELFNDIYKEMKEEKDGAKGATMARTSQDHMLKAIAEVPEMVQAMPEGADKAKAIASYRKMMAELIVILADLELAFLEGNMEKVTEIMAKMKESKKAGHDQFIEE